MAHWSLAYLELKFAYLSPVIADPHFIAIVVALHTMEVTVVVASWDP